MDKQTKKYRRAELDSLSREKCEFKHTIQITDPHGNKTKHLSLTPGEFDAITRVLLNGPKPEPPKNKYIMVTVRGGLIDEISGHTNQEKARKTAREFWKTMDAEDDDCKVLAFDQSIIWMPPRN